MYKVSGALMARSKWLPVVTAIFVAVENGRITVSAKSQVFFFRLSDLAQSRPLPWQPLYPSHSPLHIYRSLFTDLG